MYSICHVLKNIDYITCALTSRFNDIKATGNIAALSLHSLQGYVANGVRVPNPKTENLQKQRFSFSDSPALVKAYTLYFNP